MEHEEQKKSKYNRALDQLQRLENFWQEAQDKASSGNLEAWNWKLDCIWRELEVDCNPKVEGEKFQRFQKLIIQFRKKKGIYYAVLQKKHLWLRRMANEQGKGTRYFEEEDDGLEE